ncbi:acyltransferase family protein [Microbacterium amylolyticum]|uniref:Peptidoglycan/LPS O-acetylase OafA/YrhL n=1 Tax=Microbacterium amylolyticum TaxID=936337 RepID=A0ABS4ZJU6_9MICO|nr:acyltransferase family protein [Microbacterium amylolyticum]MBP2437562.1 peptidoglycan/LPS O-acetylase OafA/YrhL [Microbacterium amylolyticum]
MSSEKGLSFPIAAPLTPRYVARPTKQPGAFRPEIEGLRSVAFLLVAVFHIWFNRVSGGVDVFFTVAGFLITVSLLSQIRRFGRVRPGIFFGRLALRLLPAAAVVLTAVMLAIWFLLPYPSWRDSFTEVFASATYWENWYLARNAIDYLAIDTMRSPVQHFWAMSIQGQFYVIWAVVFTMVLLIAKSTGTRMKRVAFWTIVVLVAVSFAWSVFQTDANQQFAYFSTATRVWEFGAGALLALVIDRLRIPAVLGALLSWTAFALIASLGFLLPVADMFPGWIALIPVLSAVVIIATGRTQSRWGATQLLASKPLVWLGRLGYGVYLWHWPLLIFTLEYQGVQQASLVTGAGIIAASLALAWLTNVFVERPLLRVRDGGRGLGRRLSLAASVTAIAALAATSLTATWNLDRASDSEETVIQARLGDACFGALALADPERCARRTGTTVVPADPTHDLAPIFREPCSTRWDESDVRLCTWGDENADTKIVLIGNSHAAVWFPALLYVAEQHGWRLDTYYRQSCTFNTAYREERRAITAETCLEWNEKLQVELAQGPHYDYVLTSALALNRAYIDSETGEQSFEAGVAGFHEAWQPLIDRGSTILAVRDYPRLVGESRTCALEKFLDDCVVSQDEALIDENEETIAVAARTVNGATVIDMTEWFCSDGECPTTIGDVRVYRDHAHFTETYGHTLGEPLLQELQRQAGLPSPNQ